MLDYGLLSLRWGKKVFKATVHHDMARTLSLCNADVLFYATYVIILFTNLPLWHLSLLISHLCSFHQDRLIKWYPHSQSFPISRIKT